MGFLMLEPKKGGEILQSLFVIGGARSGKSRYAQGRAEEVVGRLTYIATAQALDDEMGDRISLHRADRGARWQTIEAPVDVAGAIKAAAQISDAILVDCLTLWLTNLLLSSQDLERATDALCQSLTECRIPLILVANEVGSGIVPDNALSRIFRDAAGRLNQAVASYADEVVMVIAGLPLRLKPQL